MQEQQPRGDYKEVLELIITFLGAVVPGKVTYNFKVPGARSKCRWMAIVHYTIKSWMFGDQLKLSKELDAKMFKLSVFICRAYVRAWFLALLASQAPRNDLAYLKVLYKNCKLGTHWQAALEKFANHLWYLPPMLVCLALFDDQVSFEEKSAMVQAMNRGDDGKPPVRADIKVGKTLLNLQLKDFVSVKSRRFFNATGISESFL